MYTTLFWTSLSAIALCFVIGRMVFRRLLDLLGNRSQSTQNQNIMDCDNLGQKTQDREQGTVQNFYGHSQCINVNSGGVCNIYGDQVSSELQEDALQGEEQRVESAHGDGLWGQVPKPTLETSGLWGQVPKPTLETRVSVPVPTTHATRREAFEQIVRKLIDEGVIQQKCDFAAVNRIRIEVDLLGKMTVRDFTKMVNTTFQLPERLCPTESIISKVVFGTDRHPNWKIKGMSEATVFHLVGVGRRFLEELGRYEFD